LTQTPINSRVTLLFNKPVAAQSVLDVAQTILTTNGVGQPVFVGLANNNTEVVLTPVNPLASNTTYTITVSGIQDVAGNVMSGTVTSSFTTGTEADLLRPNVALVDPANGATAVETNALIRVQFSERIDPVSVNNGTIQVFPSSTGVPIAGTATASADGLSATFVSTGLLPSTSYQVRVNTSGVTDLAGNGINFFQSSFTTGTGSDTDTPVGVIAVSPQNGVAGVPLNARITVQFSEPMSSVSMESNPIVVNVAGGAVVPGFLSISADHTIMMLTPNSPLSPSSTYNVSVSGVQDVSGNVAPPFTSSFSTGTATATTRPSVISVSPVNGATGIATNTSVIVTFNAPIDATSVNSGSLPIRINNSTVVNGSYAVNGAVVTFASNQQYPPSSSIFVTVNSSGVVDSAGNGANFFQSSFTTGAISVTPVGAAVPVGQTQQFSTAVNNIANTAVTWSISPAGVGSISSTGLYTAPATLPAQPTVTVTATSAADSTKTGSAVITLYVPSAFTYRRALTIDHTKVSNTDQANFPVLITGTYSFLANVANGGRVQNANGYDIIFTSDAAGTNKLDHEIESYDPAAGTINFWVRIPVLSHTADTTIYMQYGSSAVTETQENKVGVWQAGYDSVYHFANANSLGLDSAVSEYTLSQSGTVPAATGKIGGGVSFNGNASTYLFHDPVNAYPSGTAPVTLEAWIQPSGNFNGEPVGYGNNSNGGRAGIGGGGNGTVGFEFEDVGIAEGYPSDGQWHHIVGVYAGGSAAQIYLDGVQQFSSQNFGTPSITTQELKIGGIPTVTFCCAYTGSVDEVRIFTGTLTADWIATEYQNQSAPATFYSLGPESMDVVVIPSTVFLNQGQTQQFTATTVDGSSVNWSITPAGTGTVTSTGLYTAPASISTPETVSVVATNTADSTKSGIATVTLKTPYNFSRVITIDHTKIPNTDQSNFPVLISGAYSYLATVANGGKVQSANGFDIIFTSDAAGANKLDHEIDSYNGNTGAATFWVRIPALSHSTDTTIYMWYGNVGITSSQENRTGVWDGNYQMVLHLGEAGAPYRDSTSHGFSSTGGVVPTQAAGKIGSGQSFTGGQYIAYSQSQSPNPTSNITLEIWIKTTETALKGIFGKWGNDGTGDADQSYQIAYTNGFPRGALNSTDSTDVVFTAATPINDGQWHHVALTAPTTGNILIYVDGVQSGSLNNSHPLLATTGDRLTIGAVNLAEGSFLMTGVLDETRISNSIRSADWIAAEYNNQNSPSTFYTVGSEVAH
jgi:hypothetical protein